MCPFSLFSLQQCYFQAPARQTHLASRDGRDYFLLLIKVTVLRPLIKQKKKIILDYSTLLDSFICCFIHLLFQAIHSLTHPSCKYLFRHFDVSIHSLTHSSCKYLFRYYHVPNSLLGAEDTIMNKVVGFPFLTIYILSRETKENNQPDDRALRVEIRGLKKKYIDN